MSVMTKEPAEVTAIRPFTIEIRDADLDDLRARIAATRWPEKETVDDASQGVPVPKIRGPGSAMPNVFFFSADATGRCSAMLTQTTELADLQVLLERQSPLTDSNRRPPPYHGGCRLGRAGSGGNRRPRTSCKRACTSGVV